MHSADASAGRQHTAGADLAEIEGMLEVKAPSVGDRGASDAVATTTTTAAAAAASTGAVSHHHGHGRSGGGGGGGGHHRRASVVALEEHGGVTVQARDHKDIEVSFWAWDMETLRSDTVPMAGLDGFLRRTVEETLRELAEARAEFAEQPRAERRKAIKGGSTPRPETCRWFHLPGCSHAAVDMIRAVYQLDAQVAAECKDAASKPACSWHQTHPDSSFDHLFIVGHYIIPRDDVGPDGIRGFQYEQVFLLYFADLNTVISIDGNGEKTWEGVVDLLSNQRGFVRTNGNISVLLYKLIDSMIDEVYPLLDLYGDLLETLEFDMINAQEPTDTHVRDSYKLDRAVRSLRRYAWNARQLLQELRQNNFGVIAATTVKMLQSVERNSENITEVASAYIDQCDGITDFYGACCCCCCCCCAVRC
jgi:hypothetical protein